MLPKSLSATAIQVAEACMARFKAEHIDRGRGESGTAALLGSSVHGALELYVKFCYLDKTQQPGLQLLLDLFKMSFTSTTGSTEYTSVDYKDGVNMLKDWFARTDFSLFTVISCEVKSNFPIPVGPHEIPFNYIWDRFDQIGETEYKVVDYKTNRAGVSPEDLKEKPQARAYGLAAQIQHPDATRIWVEFDMLRHGGPVGISFSREDNVATWKYLKAQARRIWETPDDKPPPETLNTECGFCVRKTTCLTVRRNIMVGGVQSLSPEEKVDARYELALQKKAITDALSELDRVILAEAKEADIIEFEGDMANLKLASRKTRQVDPDMAFRIIGPELTQKYGGAKLSIAAVDALLKGDELDEMQKRKLSGLIVSVSGAPYVATKKKDRF